MMSLQRTRTRMQLQSRERERERESTYRGEDAQEVREEEGDKSGQVLIAQVVARGEHLEALDGAVHELRVVHVEALDCFHANKQTNKQTSISLCTHEDHE